MSGADRDRENIAAMQAEIARVDALPLSRLAAEVMIRAFGPDGPGGPGKPGTIDTPGTGTGVGLEEIARLFTPAFGGRGVMPDLNRRLLNLVAEGMQILQNAALVRISYRQQGFEHCLATRRGRAALATGELELILDRNLR